MRLIRNGLEALGLDANSFLRHHSRRLIYAVPLCANTEDVVLQLTTTPDYLLPPGAAGTAILIDHWRDRWLSSRITRPEVLESVRSEDFEGFRLSREADRLTAGSGGGTSGRRAGRVGTGVEVGLRVRPRERAIAPSSSDCIGAPIVMPTVLPLRSSKSIHVDLGVDGYLVAKPRPAARSSSPATPATARPPDERLRQRLEALGARVITDANACSDAEILEQWEASRDDGKPFVLAINEWPLYVLQRLATKSGFAPVGEALRQVTSARFFVELHRPAEAKENVSVIDLSLRNLLSASVVERVIDRLTQDKFFAGLNAADPAIANRDALREPQVRERFVRLLELVATGPDTLRCADSVVHLLPHYRRTVRDRPGPRRSGHARVRLLQLRLRWWRWRSIRRGPRGLRSGRGDPPRLG